MSTASVIIRSIPEEPTLSINTLGGGGGAGGGISDVVGNTGILVDVVETVATITNSGVTQLLAGAGVSVDQPTGVVTIANTGVVSVAPGGTGINASVTDGVLSLENSGVLSVATSGAQSGLAITGPANAPVFANIGVRSLVAGTGIQVSGANGDVTVSSTGVSPTAGAFISGYATMTLPTGVAFPSDITISTAPAADFYTNGSWYTMSGVLHLSSAAAPSTTYIIDLQCSGVSGAGQYVITQQITPTNYNMFLPFSITFQAPISGGLFRFVLGSNDTITPGDTITGIVSQAAVVKIT